MDKDRFCRLWNRCTGGETDAANAVFAELAGYYGQPHRYYHTGGHIVDCLSRMDMARAELGHSDSVELAIWFHDVIYEPGAADNERQSADWFVDKASGCLPPEMIREVDDYIMSTLHREIPADNGAKFVVDVDLSGLGMAPEMFNRDGDNIRKEFAHLSDDEFYCGQNGFLQKLLDRRHIYATPFFQNLCEARARQNISELLARCAK